MHKWSQLSFIIEGSLSFLLNSLPTRKQRSFHSLSLWSHHWSAVCSILFEINTLHHQKLPLSHSLSLKGWLPRTQTDAGDISLSPYTFTFFFFFFFFFLILKGLFFWSPYTPFDLTWAIRVYWRHRALVKIFYYK